MSHWNEQNSHQSQQQIIENLQREVEDLKSIINEFHTHNEYVKKALVDIAIALEKISKVEHDLSEQRTKTNDQEKMINSIFNKLPLIEQTITWVNRGIISLIGIIGLIVITQLFDTGSIIGGG